ncbi:MAG TPA: DUF2239 family protein [Gemmatimonadaceae bacterium]|nr:DUF2239 family protein [Gemmatimonadaceae bacterium]
MSQFDQASWIAFAGTRRIHSGMPADVARAAKAAVDKGEQTVLVFDDASRVVDIDYRGSDEDMIARLGRGNDASTRSNGNGEAHDASPYLENRAPRGRGRPRLGVVAREVTLLPRHWDWLATQPGGASAAVRRLVDAARQSSVEKDRVRTAKESAYRFISTMAGNEQGFEEATRALFAGDEVRFVAMSDSWPRDVREHARALARRASA